MIQRDYIMRMIELMTKMFAKALFLKDEGKQDEALNILDNSLKETIGIDPLLLDTLPLKNITDLLGMSTDTSTGAIKCLLCGKLLKERAVCDQKDYTLNADLDDNLFWITDEAMETEEALVEARKNGYEMPEGVNLAFVASSGVGEMHSGVAEIFFYKKGYSDQAVIVIEDEDDRKLYFNIEPFLPAVKLFEE